MKRNYLSQYQYSTNYLHHQHRRVDNYNIPLWITNVPSAATEEGRRGGGWMGGKRNMGN